MNGLSVGPFIAYGCAQNERKGPLANNPYSIISY